MHKDRVHRAFGGAGPAGGAGVRVKANAGRSESRQECQEAAHWAHVPAEGTFYEDRGDYDQEHERKERWRVPEIAVCDLVEIPHLPVGDDLPRSIRGCGQAQAPLQAEDRRERVGLADRLSLKEQWRQDQQDSGAVLPEFEDLVDARWYLNAELRPMEDLLECAHGADPPAEVASEQSTEAQDRQGAHQMSCPAVNRPVSPEEEKDVLNGLDRTGGGPLEEAEEDEGREQHQASSLASPRIEEQRGRCQ